METVRKLPYNEIKQLNDYYTRTVDTICFDEKFVTPGTPEVIINTKAYRWRVVFTFNEEFAK